MSLKLIWEPMKIGSLEVPNRIARSAHGTTSMPDSVNDDFIAYHLARARNGVGLSILEAASVHYSSVASYMVNDNAMVGYDKLVKAIRPHGMRLIQQLWHGGHIYPGQGGIIPWAVSSLPSPSTGMVGLPMGQTEIDEVIAAFTDAARRCRDSGLDGVEVHAAHGYLIQQFLSPLTNNREDHYNGDIYARARFLVEMLKSIRSAVGADFVVGARLGPSAAAGGLTASDVAKVARHLEEQGLVDFIDISYADYFKVSGVAGTMTFPSGYQIPINEEISRAVKVPRLVTGRYRTLEEAEQVLREGQADLVSLVRAMIADPTLVRLTKESRAEDVRPCIACNQGCVAGLWQAGKMQCAVNPVAGHEKLLDEELMESAAVSKKVLVVGGGPGGMEAARIAALRGHKVVLAEAAPTLGGTLQVAKTAPNIHILGDLVEWMERRVYALGVDVRLSTYMDADDVLAEQPDAVIIATGAMAREDGRQANTPGEMPIGANLPHVTEPIELITSMRDSLQGKAALVYDDVGRYEAIAAAEHLMKLGASVTFVTSQGSFAPRMAGTTRDSEALSRLSNGDFRLLISHSLITIKPGVATVRPLGTSKDEKVHADIVVLVTHRTPLRSLYDELNGRVPEIGLVGDARSPRDLMAAIHEGHRFVRSI